MNQKLKDECYRLCLLGYNNREIATKLNLNQDAVIRIMTSVTKSHDYQLGFKLKITSFQQD